MADRDPGRIAALRGAMERYVKDSESAGLRTATTLSAPSAGTTARYAAGQVAALLGGLPLAIAVSRRAVAHLLRQPGSAETAERRPSVCPLASTMNHCR